MTIELTHKTLQIIGFIAAGLTLYGLVALFQYMKKKDQQAVNDEMIKNSHLEVKKSRRRTRYYLLTDLGSYRVRRRVTFDAFLKYKELGIPVRGFYKFHKHQKQITIAEN